MKQSAVKEEDRLLHLCSSPDGKGVEPEKLVVSLTSQIKDWDRFLQKAAYHRLQPRLYFYLKRKGAFSFLEPEIWKKIEAAHLWAQAYVLAHEAELTRILLPKFNEAGIDVLLLKGAALLQTVYQENPIRFFVDLDLLVHREDLARVQAILQRARYQTQSVFPSRWYEQGSGLKFNRAHYEFFNSERGIQLDLHVEAFEAWSLFRLKPNWLWEDAQPISLAGAQAFLPHPNRLFAHLLLHLARHRNQGQNILGWYLDLDQCLRYFNRHIDGCFCRQLILENPYITDVLKILAFADFHFCSPLPKELQLLLKENEVNPPPLESIFEIPQKSEFAIFNHPDSSERFLFYWSQIASFRKKILLLLSWVFPDIEYLRIKYRFRNLGQWGVAYLRHLMTIILKGVSLSFNLLRKGFRRGLREGKKSVYY